MRSPLSRRKEGGDGCSLNQQVVASYHDAKRGFNCPFPREKEDIDQVRFCLSLIVCMYLTKVFLCVWESSR